MSDIWAQQYTLGTNPVPPRRPDAVSKLLKQKAMSDARENKIKFVDRGIGTMADGLDQDLLKTIAQEFWKQDSEVHMADYFNQKALLIPGCINTTLLRTYVPHTKM